VHDIIMMVLILLEQAKHMMVFGADGLSK